MPSLYCCTHLIVFSSYCLPLQLLLCPSVVYRTVLVYRVLVHPHVTADCNNIDVALGQPVWRSYIQLDCLRLTRYTFRSHNAFCAVLCEVGYFFTVQTLVGFNAILGRG